jgi:2-oxoglutarate ferredoxin oxidoreductase subunit delta
MAKGWVYVDEDRCKGCSLCVEACPQHVLALSTDHFNAKGYRPVQLVDPDNCTGCAICAITCPDVVFTVYREARKKKAAPATSEAKVAGA